MRYLLILLFCSQCFASPAFVKTLLSGGCHNTTAATTLVCTPGATSSIGNDVVVTMGFKTTTRTVKTVTATGATFMQVVGENPNGTGSFPTAYICHKCAVAISASTPITITLNGTSLTAAAVEEYSGVAELGTANFSTGTSQTPNSSTSINDANNIVIAAISNLGNGGTISANTGSLRDSGCTGSTSSNVCLSHVDNTSASPGASVIGKTTIGTSVAWAAVIFELRGSNAPMTDHVGSYGTESAQDGTGTANAFAVPLSPEIALSGNVAVCMIAWPAGTAAPSPVTDDKSDTFTQAIEEDGANLRMGLWVGSTTAGAHLLNYSFGSALAISATMVEHCANFYNATTTVDATCGQASVSGPSVNCNAASNMTLTATDIVFNVSILDGSLGASNTDMGPCRAGLGFTLLIPANVAGWCSQFQITGTSFNPNIYFAPFSSGAGGPTAPSYMVAGVAIKTSNGAGTAPTGMHISREWQASVSSGLVNGNMGCPSNGGFMSGFVSQSAGTYTAKSSDGVAWTNNKPNSQFLYDTNATNLDDSSGCQLTDTDAGNDEIFFRDIAGVATSSPIVVPSACPSTSTLVNTGSNIGCEGTGTNANPSTQNPNITPTNSGDLILDSVIAGTGPLTACTAPTGCVIDCGTYTGQTDASFWCLGEAHSHFYTTSTSTLNFSYTYTSGVAPTGTAVEIKPQAAPPPSSCVPTLTLMGVGSCG